MNFRTAALAMLTASLATFGTGALAQDHACKDDLQKFCKDVQPGGGLIAKCLKEHHDAHTDACKAAFDKRASRFKERREKAKANPNAGKFEESCGDDVNKYCAKEQAGDGSIMGCLRKHRNELSPSCRALWKGRGPGKPPPEKSSDVKSDQ